VKSLSNRPARIDGVVESVATCVTNFVPNRRASGSQKITNSIIVLMVVIDRNPDTTVARDPQRACKHREHCDGGYWARLARQGSERAIEGRGLGRVLQTLGDSPYPLLPLVLFWAESSQQNFSGGGPAPRLCGYVRGIFWFEVWAETSSMWPVDAEFSVREQCGGTY
jgi:hypothetical protein